jgi:hypothetical protein
VKRFQSQDEQAATRADVLAFGESTWTVDPQLRRDEVHDCQLRELGASLQEAQHHNAQISYAAAALPLQRWRAN